MLQQIYLNKLKKLPDHSKQFGGLVVIVIIVILSFAILNAFFGIFIKYRINLII